MLKTDLHPNAAVKSFRKPGTRQRFHLDATPFAVANYDAIMMLGALIKKTGSPTRKLKDAFNSVKNFKGLQGIVSFSKQNHATITTKQLRS